MRNFTRIFAFIFAILICVGCFASCNKTTDNPVDNPVDNTETTDANENGADTSDVVNKPIKDSIEKNEQDMCVDALNSIEMTVINKEVVPYSDALIDGKNANKYDKATILTIGIKFPKEVYDEYWNSMYINGETATDEDGKGVPQSVSGTSWVSDDRSYALLVYRIAGEIDASKVNVLIKGRVKGASTNIKFANPDGTKDFSDAIKAFAEKDNMFGVGNRIVELKGRHYFIVRRYNSASVSMGNDSGTNASKTESFILIPIEGGLGRTLSDKDFTLITSEEIPNTTVTLKVNAGDAVDKNYIQSQTTIELEVVRQKVEEKNEDGEYDEDSVRAFIGDIYSATRGSTVEIDDGHGNKVTLKFAD